MENQAAVYVTVRKLKEDIGNYRGAMCRGIIPLLTDQDAILAGLWALYGFDALADVLPQKTAFVDNPEQKNPWYLSIDQLHEIMGLVKIVEHFAMQSYFLPAELAEA